ncbi:MAG: hypothetical protein LH466_08455 [Sphingomonas bacterium]|nr:hypothetical protein [Sphingomonas bacterium]
MRTILLGACTLAVLAIASPAAAQSRYDRNGNGVPDYRERAYADLNGNGILDYRETRRMDVNRNGTADWRERFIDANRNRIDDRQEGYRYGMKWNRDDSCASGVAKRNMKCVSSKKVAKEEWKRGYRVPTNYGYTTYNEIPMRYRNQYSLNRNYNYVYRDNQIYVVNRNTNLVERIIDNLR